jgi:hypothetical protein
LGNLTIAELFLRCGGDLRAPFDAITNQRAQIQKLLMPTTRRKSEMAAQSSSNPLKTSSGRQIGVNSRYSCVKSM